MHLIAYSIIWNYINLEKLIQICNLKFWTIAINKIDKKQNRKNKKYKRYKYNKQ